MRLLVPRKASTQESEQAARVHFMTDRGAALCRDPRGLLRRAENAGAAPLKSLSNTSNLSGRHKRGPICGNFVGLQGAERTRTAVRGFAGLCLTSRPRRQERPIVAVLLTP